MLELTRADQLLCKNKPLSTKLIEILVLIKILTKHSVHIISFFALVNAVFSLHEEWFEDLKESPAHICHEVLFIFFHCFLKQNVFESNVVFRNTLVF